MHRYVVTITQEIEADTAEEAALLMYAELTRRPPPLTYSVTDEAMARKELSLERDKADEFARVDHTADPGNW